MTKLAITKRYRKHPGVYTSLIAFIVLFVSGVFVQANSGFTDVEVSESAPNALAEISLVLKSVEPDKQVANFTMIVEPKSNPDGSRPVAFKEPLTVELSSVEGSSTVSVPAGQLPRTESIRFLATNSPDQTIETWPFDRYTGRLVIQLYTGSSENPTFQSFDLDISGNAPGWKMSAALQPMTDEIRAYDPNLFAYNISVSHSASIWVLNILLVLILLSLPLMAIFVAVRVHQGRLRFNVDFSGWDFAGWFAAMLFAVIPIRSFLPGNPPPGSWIDLTVTIWVFIGLVSALIVYIRAWVLNTPIQKLEASTGQELVKKRREDAEGEQVEIAAPLKLPAVKVSTDEGPGETDRE